MDTRELKQFAEEHMRLWGLMDAGWTFRFDGARRRFGICRFDDRVISISRHLTGLNEADECFDTVLHEIAHALAGRQAGHGPVWREMCRRVGARPQRCYDAREVAEPEPSFQAVCPNCDHRVGFHRRPSRQRACATCCRQFNGGKFSSRFLMYLVEARSGRRVSYASGPRSGYVGRCPSCKKQYVFRRRHRAPRACGVCCRAHAAGRYDERFRLEIKAIEP